MNQLGHEKEDTNNSNSTNNTNSFLSVSEDHNGDVSDKSFFSAQSKSKSSSDDIIENINPNNDTLHLETACNSKNRSSLMIESESQCKTAREESKYFFKN